MYRQLQRLIQKGTSVQTATEIYAGEERIQIATVIDTGDDICTDSYRD